MLFNSLDFAVFLPIVFVLYWFVTNRSLKFQNLLILGASYFFYACWDYRFLALILFSTIVDFTVGLALAKENNIRTRKILLLTSVIINLGFLGFFKYYNFFLGNFIDAFSFFGQKINVGLLHIILPVGISFYTFQTLSYTIDIYRKQLEPTKNFIVFASFVAFFPQLVAGPIERASHLLPQFYKKREFNYSLAVDGMQQILWGLFKKVVIADGSASIVNEIFNNYHDYSGSTIVLGVIFFNFQLYGDFAGYSDIAIGVSRLFGFDLKRNFAFPYFARDIAEFYRRWHISLTTWFRDYLYIPLGGSRVGLAKRIRNVFIIYIVSGFWHGANWTFIVWGALNAIYYLPLMIFNINRSNLDIVAKGKLLPGIKDVSLIMITFALTGLSRIFFRSDNIQQALTMLSSIFNFSLFKMPYFPGMGLKMGLMVMVVVYFTIEWIGREQDFGLQIIRKVNYRPVRWASFLLIALSIFYYSITIDGQQFIYFQF
ncbi:MBOAT family O-acyltransferase [Formosa sp. S-31]|uniref:MBOAT family O-acyltransferase n=1 Tax=Formosa sp. S-31 TaxID=2790949 RepID=UPI003EB78730